MNRESMLQQVADEDKYNRIGAVIRGILALLPNVSVQKKGRVVMLFYNHPDINR